MRGDFFLFFHGHIVADIGRKEKPCFLFFAAAYTGMSAMLNAKKEETHLEKNDTAVKICGTTEGRLPGSCAPLAFPYVPVQCDNPARYSQQDALQAGTLFPGLNLPLTQMAPSVLNDVRHAKQHGHKIVAFTRRGDSKLAQLSDLVFVLDGTKQTLAGSLPNPFFGHVILVFEDLMARYFERKESV